MDESTLIQLATLASVVAADEPFCHYIDGIHQAAATRPQRQGGRPA